MFSSLKISIIERMVNYDFKTPKKRPDHAFACGSDIDHE
ncbi:hypothetical protein DOT_1077 [Desulfosporosinus sp. OT]|nr:hypothetical protein DOT_1077 [Desulfosporosinus sp. OT]